MSLEQIRADRDKKIAKLLGYFGAIMAIFYFVMGVAFLILPQFVAYTGEIRYIVSPLLIIYGCFRVYRLFKAKEETTDEETE